MIYRQGTSVAVNDLEREISFLLPNDDYFDAGGEATHKKKKRIQKGSNIGLKTVNRIDIEKVNKDQPTNKSCIEEEPIPLNTLEDEILEMMRYQEIDPTAARPLDKKKVSSISMGVK